MKFYQDPVYIEMCRKAEEIQRKYPAHTGNIDIWQGEKPADNVCVDENGDFWCADPLFDGWLPRLDQLIRIAMDQNTPSAPDPLWPDSLLNRFAYWSGYVGHGLHEDPAATLERLTLRYIMDLKHGKRWTGSEWVKI
jgi:hypothetical protein